MIGPARADLRASLRFRATAAELERVFAQRPGPWIDLGSVAKGLGGEGTGGEPHAGLGPQNSMDCFGTNACFAEAGRAAEVGVGHDGKYGPPAGSSMAVLSQCRTVSPVRWHPEDYLKPDQAKGGPRVGSRKSVLAGSIDGAGEAAA